MVSGRSVTTTDGIIAAYPNTHRNLNRLSTFGVFNRDRVAAGFDPRWGEIFGLTSL